MTAFAASARLINYPKFWNLNCKNFWDVMVRYHPTRCMNDCTFALSIEINDRKRTVTFSLTRSFLPLVVSTQHYMVAACWSKVSCLLQGSLGLQIIALFSYIPFLIIWNLCLWIQNPFIFFTKSLVS